MCRQLAVRRALLVPQLLSCCWWSPSTTSVCCGHSRTCSKLPCYRYGSLSNPSLLAQHKQQSCHFCTWWISPRPARVSQGMQTRVHEIAVKPPHQGLTAFDSAKWLLCTPDKWCFWFVARWFCLLSIRSCMANSAGVHTPQLRRRHWSAALSCRSHKYSVVLIPLPNQNYHFMGPF